MIHRIHTIKNIIVRSVLATFLVVAGFSGLLSAQPEAANMAQHIIKTPSFSHSTTLSIPNALGVTKGRVMRIIDGDTLKMDVEGIGVTSVRLIGIDTPESRKNKRTLLQAQRNQTTQEAIISMGKKATLHMKSLVKRGDILILECDVQQTDKYGRLLAYAWYAWTDTNIMLNLEMVKDGYASLLTIPPNVKYKNDFRKAYTEAREAKKGLWK
jgi:micrococcal nuclease